MVWQLVKALDIPVMGIGGIAHRSRRRRVPAGGRGVRAGGHGGLCRSPARPARIADELEAFIAEQGLDDVHQWIGTLDDTPIR